MSGLPSPFTSAKDTKFGTGRLERPITALSRSAGGMSWEAIEKSPGEYRLE